MLRPCQRTNKVGKHEGDGDISCSYCTWKGTRKLGNVPEGRGRLEVVQSTIGLNT